MKPKRTTWLLALRLLAVLCFEARAEVTVYRSKKRPITLEQVIAAIDAGNLYHVPDGVINFGYELNPSWFIVQTKPYRSDYLFSLSYPFESVKLFSYSSGQFPKQIDHEFLVNKTGYLFHIDPAEYYIFRIETRSATVFNLQYQSHESIHEKLAIRSATLGVFNGVLLITLILAILAALILHSSLIGSYSAYLGAYIVLQAAINNLFFDNTLSLNIVEIFQPICISFLAIFSNDFLKIRRKGLKRDVFAILGIWLAAVLVLSYRTSVTISHTISIIFTLYYLSYALWGFWKTRESCYWQYIAGWSGLLLGVVILSLKAQGIVRDNIISNYAINTGALLQVITLGFFSLRQFWQAEKDNTEQQRQTIKFQAIANTAQALVHETRRPLNNLQRFLNNVRTRKPDEIVAYIDAYADLVDQDIKSASSMLSELIEIGNPNSNRHEQFDLKKLIEEAASQFSINFTLTLFSANIFGPKEKVKHVFENIFENAKDATANKSAQFWTKMYRNRGKILIEVGNTLSRISPESLPNIFEVFFTRNKAQGSGIGLAFSKKVIDDIHGRIWCESCGYSSLGAKTTVPPYDADYVVFIIELPEYGGQNA